MGAQSSDPLFSNMTLISLINWKVEVMAIYLALDRFVTLIVTSYLEKFYAS